jgi:hypothetical protein
MLVSDHIEIIMKQTNTNMLMLGGCFAEIAQTKRGDKFVVFKKNRKFYKIISSSTLFKRKEN